MSLKIRVLRGPTEAIEAYLGQPGQLCLDTTRNLLFFHDGVVVGGHRLSLTQAQVQAIIADTLANYPFTVDDQNKLDGIQEGATHNSPDSFLLDRSNHQGTQPADTIEGLASGAFQDVSAFPFVNLMPDSGRFSGRINPLSLGSGADFVASSFLDLYNGASVSSAGKFIHNNTTGGGSAGALTQSIIDLLVEQGRPGAAGRYGVEFFAARYTAGPFTNTPRDGLDGIRRYLLTVCNARNLFGAGNMGTFTCWLRVISGSLLFSATAYNDKVVLPERTPILPGVWKHYRTAMGQAIGYNNEWPSMFVEPGSVVEIALPAFFNGEVNPGVYKSPIATVNELMA